MTGKHGSKHKDSRSYAVPITNYMRTSMDCWKRSGMRARNGHTPHPRPLSPRLRGERGAGNRGEGKHPTIPPSPLVFEGRGVGGEGCVFERWNGNTLTMIAKLTPSEAMERINTIVAHAWMVRTFLKHAPEFEEDVERMEIPRAI